MHGKTFSMAACLAALGVAAPLALAQEASAPGAAPAGESKTAKTKTLEAGARILQGNAPVQGFDIYLVGFHPMKEHPEMQMEAQNYCHQVNQDFAQCVLFDGNTGDANLNGIEYIISEKLFESLPQEERKYWHPHNGEILSGQLVAPGIPEVAETSLMKDKMNSYGKTWHVWNTGTHDKPGDDLPLGEPHLAWSFSRDGEAQPALIRRRDESLGVDTAETRRGREDLQSLAKPQAGVDALHGRFARRTTPVPGVIDQKAGDTKAGDKGGTGN